MLASFRATLHRVRWYLLVLLVLYALCIAGGALSASGSGEAASPAVDKQSEGQNAQLESMFGRFRQPLRDGQAGTMVVVTLIVFGVNMLGGLIGFTIPGMLILPLGFTLLMGGWQQGAELSSLRASSTFSLAWFLVVVGLEAVTYVVASAAGANLGISLLIPRTQQETSRRRAFKRALADAGRLYVLIAAILAVQAVVEMLYVQKVLQMGGSGIPLRPY